MNQENSLTLAYVGSGCNKSAHIMDWNANNFICFGSCNFVATYNASSGKIIGNLVTHSDKITCVKWIKYSTEDKNELISGSADGKVFVSSLQFQSGIFNTSSVELIGHRESILSVEGIYRRNYCDTVVATTASDNTVRIWLRSTKENVFSCCKLISTGLGFALCLSMVQVPNNFVTLLALGTDAPELLLYSIGQLESETSYLTKASGHEDWIRSVDMAVFENEDILIATSSQDMMIRISKLSLKSSDLPSESFSLKKEEVHIGPLIYFLSLETVLFGHEGWVYSVNWSPNVGSEGLSLLTASFDRTLIIWKPCPDSGVWLEEARMGEMGGDNTLGYYGAKFSPDGSSVLAHSYQGSFHLWRREDNKWVADYIIGGHSDAVMDISWERNGRYLLSVSSDKTTRLHAPCLKGISLDQKPWCELSRPQIHGHALYSITALPNLGFASCSEEKVVRVFSPSHSVLKLLNYFCDSHFEKESLHCTLPSSASITALGLSNKATFENEEKIVPRDSENLGGDVIPNEDYLAQNTLWPEIMKLYGHGNDVFCLAASNDGKLLASASKATSADQAKIILWDTLTWNIITKLEGHQLTVTQMSFSPDDTYLLSVSRDRKWCLFKKDDRGIYSLSCTAQKGTIMHSRIIWSCAWSHDSLYFVTGSRDCKVIVWDKENAVANMTSDHGPVTAVSFGPINIDVNKYILAIGHDSGSIQIFNWSLNEWKLLHSVASSIGHHLTVQKLQFRPHNDRTQEVSENGSILQLASCSADHSVRLFDIAIEKT